VSFDDVDHELVVHIDGWEEAVECITLNVGVALRQHLRGLADEPLLMFVREHNDRLEGRFWDYKGAKVGRVLFLI
jgi:hypothetical protein